MDVPIWGKYVAGVPATIIKDEQKLTVGADTGRANSVRGANKPAVSSPNWRRVHMGFSIGDEWRRVYYETRY